MYAYTTDNFLHNELHVSLKEVYQIKERQTDRQKEGRTKERKKEEIEVLEEKIYFTSLMK